METMPRARAKREARDYKAGRSPSHARRAPLGGRTTSAAAACASSMAAFSSFSASSTPTWVRFESAFVPVTAPCGEGRTDRQEGAEGRKRGRAVSVSQELRAAGNENVAAAESSPFGKREGHPIRLLPRGTRQRGASRQRGPGSSTWPPACCERNGLSWSLDPALRACGK